MMKSLIKLFQSSSKTVETFAPEKVVDNLTLLRELLLNDENRLVRIYADTGSGMGHQAAAVRVLDRLMAPVNDPVPGFEYLNPNRKVEIVYNNGSPITVKNLRKLLEWDETQSSGDYGRNGRTVLVELIPESTFDPSRGWVNFGFSGASDGSIDYPSKMHVHYFLRLQPFTWGYPEEIQIKTSENVETITVTLTDVKELGGSTFDQRGLYIPIPEAIDWARYTGAPWTPDQINRAEILEILIQNQNHDGRRRYDILFTYSIHTTTTPDGDPRPSSISADPFAQAFTLMTGVMASQSGVKGKVDGALPAVIVNLDSFQIDPTFPYKNPNGNPFDPVIDLLNGNPTKEEEVNGVGAQSDEQSPKPLQKKFQQLFDFRKDYLQEISAALRYYFSDGLQSGNTQALIDELLNPEIIGKWGIQNIDQRVLWIQLGNVPPTLFPQLLRKSTLPSLFEGANTANVAVNIPSMYYRITSLVNPKNVYPSTILASNPSSSTLNFLKTAANQIARCFRNWPNNRKNEEYPPEVFAIPIKEDRKKDKKSPYRAYFQNVAEFYTDPANDKLSLALAYMYSLVQKYHVVQLSMELAADDESPLPGLWDKLQANLKNGTLSLVPGALTAGTIKDFLAELVKDTTGQDFAIDNATLARDPESGDTIDSITAAGTFKAFGEPIPLSLKFTAESNKLKTAVTFTFGEEIFFDGMDWIPLKKVDLTLWVGEDLSIPRGRLDAEITEDIHVILRLPGDKGNVLIEGVFGKNGNGSMPVAGTNYPSIGKFFSMAGGINLVDSMPPPLNVLADLGLAKVEIGLDQNEKKVEFISILLKNNSSDPLPLFSNVSLEDISVNVSIQNPGDTANRTVNTAVDGEFWIGPPNQETSGLIGVGARTPEFTFSGELKKGKIQLTEFITLFCPGIEIPTSGQTPSIDAFSFSYDHPQKSASISIDLGIYMSIEVGDITPIKIENIALSVNRLSGGNGNGKNGNNGQQSDKAIVKGNLTGNFILFPKSEDALGLSLVADYDGSGWTFKAQQTSGEIKLFKLVSRVLGDAFAPPSNDLSFNELKAEIQPQLGAYKFSGKTAEPWKIEILDIEIAGSFALEYRKKKNGNTNGLLSARTVLPAAPLDPWSPPRPAIPLGPLSHRGRAALRRAQLRHPKSLPILALDSQLPLKDDDPTGLSGTISAQVKWEKIELDVHYSFKKPEGGGTDHDLDLDLLLDGTPVANAHIQKNDKNQYTAEFKFTSDTVGGLIETFVSWATGSKFSLGAPWNLLDHVPLNKFSIIFNFETKDVSFGLDIGPISLGLATIKRIGLEYASVDGKEQSPKKVQVTLEGTFVWQDDKHKPLSWNAANPNETPAPPGGGNKYFDLRMLMMGQRVEFSGTETIKTVKQLIDDIDKLSPPKGSEIPLPLTSTVDPKVKLDFAPDAGWLFGADFSILKLGDDEVKSGQQNYLLSLSIVFNDPKLYALRIALAGKAAKVFAGLQFEIMYQQVSKTVGVYRMRVALPFKMRTFSVGAGTITLPEFGIGIYTNGDFEVDLGFPWNEDFSVSFTLQVIVYGIPVMGSIGIYFAKLSNTTANQLPAGISVPNATNGDFNPVIAFGIGIQLGLGYTFNAGVLTAGFSLTAFGIVQGVLAKWHPFDGTSYGTTGNDQLDGEYYFQLVGTFGIIGRLFGSVDFGIISADLNVDIKIYAQITYEVYAPIALTAAAEVSVSLKFSINLGFFKIHFSFHFSAHVKHTFTLDISNTDAPWIVDSSDANAALASSQSVGLLGGPATNRLYSYKSRNGRMGLQDVVEVFVPNWDNFKPVVDEKQQIVTCPLKGYFTPALAAAGEGTQDKTQQKACYIAMLSILGPNTESGLTESRNAAALDSTITSFETLCVLVAKWAAAAIQPSTNSYTRESIKTAVVTETGLKNLRDYLAESKANDPIPSGEINTFLNNQIGLTLSAPDPSVTGDVAAVVFPVPPKLKLDAPEIGNQPGVSYLFGEYNSTNTDFLEEIKNAFKELRVNVQQEDGDSNGSTLKAVKTDGGPSVAEFIFNNYFVLIMQQIVQLMLDGLRDFHWSIAGDLGDRTVADILSAIDAAANVPDGQSPPVGSEKVVVLPSDLFIANASHPLTEVVRVSGAKLNTRAQDSFDDLAKAAFGAPADRPFFDGKSLAIQNDQADKDNDDEQKRQILRVGAIVTYPKKTASQAEKKDVDPDYEIQDGDTLTSVAAHFSVTVEELIDASKSDVLTQKNLLNPLVSLKAPEFDYSPPNDGTENLQILSGRFGVEVASFAAGDDNPNVTQTKGFFSNQGENKDYLHVPHLPQFQVQPLIYELRRSLGLQNLSGMASRFLLHGLRLPVADVNPKAAGIFVEGDAKSGFHYPETIKELGVYALSGQEIAIPGGLEPTSGYSLTLTWTDSQSPWLKFSGNAASLPFPVSDPTVINHITELQTYIHENLLNTGIQKIGQNETFKIVPSRYAIRSKITWTSSGPPALPSDGQTPPTGIPLNVLSLPLNVSNLQAQQMRVSNGTEEGKYIDREIAPRFKIQTVRYDESLKGVTERSIERQGFGSFINFTIKKITENPSSPSTMDTYEIVGANTEDIVTLERLLNAIQSDDDKISSITLLYPTDAQSTVENGVLSDPVDSVYMGIARVNMSTVTRPPSGLAMDLLDAQSKTESTLYNTKTEFLRFLWEASITRSGGFYLYYYNKENTTGLPDGIFNENHEAHVALLVLYPFEGESKEERSIPSYVNCSAVAEGLSGKNMAVVAESVEKKYSIQTAGDESIEQVAFQYYRTPGDVALAASALQLKDKTSLTVTGGVYQIPIGGGTPGRSVDSLAAYFHTTSEALKKVNPRISDETWKNLPDLFSIQLPKISIEADASSGGTTLAEIAAYYGTTLESLGADNRSSALFAPNQPLTVFSGPVSRNATEPPGVIGYEIVRNAEEENQDFTPENYLRTVYSMLGYRVVQNQDFIASNPGLPAGPGNAKSEGEGKLRIAQSDPSNLWKFTRDVPTYNFVPPNGNVVSNGVVAAANSTSPYKALGRLMQVKFNWQDIYGNRILTNLSQNDFGPGWSNQTPILTGYHDPIFGVGQWPSISTTYEISGPGSGQDPTLTLNFNFSTSRYLQDDSNGNGNAAANAVKPNPENAKHDIVRFNRILQQLNDPAGLTIDVETSLMTAPIQTPDRPIEDLSDWITKIVQFLKEVESGKTPTPEPSLLEHPWSLSMPYQSLTTSQVAEITVEFSIQRDDRYVEGSFKSTPGIAKATTQIAPRLSKSDSDTTSDETKLLTLEEFAADFEKALSDGQTKVKLATGVNRFKLSGQNNGDALWAVRLANQQDVNEGMWIAVEDPQNPLVYSAKPLSNKLISRDSVKIRKYKTGEPLDVESKDYTTSAFTNIDMDRWMQTFLEAIDRYLCPTFTSPTLILQNLKNQTGDNTYLSQITECKKLIAGNLSKLLIPVLKGQSGSEDQATAAQEVYKQSLLERLSNAYTPSVVLQFPTKVGAQIHEPIINNQQTITPQLYGSIATENKNSSLFENGDPSKNYTLSSPKIPLATTEEGKPVELTTLLTAQNAGNAPSGAGSDSGTVTVQGSYQGSNIEHQIGLLKDIQDYQASSWLEFVLDLNSAPSKSTDAAADPSIPLYFNGPIGPVTVPIVLRAFPSTPNMQSQSQVDFLEDVWLPNASNSLDEIRRWKYKFKYSQDYHYPQDFVTGSTTFNHKIESDALNALGDVDGDPLPDLLETLAEFTTQYPAIEKDLNSYLQKIYGKPPSPEDEKNAWAVLQSLNALINYVATALENELRAKPYALVSDAAGASVQPFDFSIVEIGATIDATDVLIVAVVGTPPDGMGAPDVEIKDYTSEAHTLDETIKTKILESLDLPATTTITSYAFYQINNGERQWLSLGAGRAIPERSIVLPIADVLVRQNAQSSLKTVRNKEIDGIEIADCFVYETAEISFPNPLTPSVFRRGLDIATVGGKEPQKQTIQNHLTDLFNNLFEKNAPEQNTLQMTVTYSYSINSIDSMVALPILLLPPTQTDRSITVKDDGDIQPLQQVIQTVSSGINQWFDDSEVLKNNGDKIFFDLTILTNLTEKPSPLLTIDQMYLDIQYVEF